MYYQMLLLWLAKLVANFSQVFMRPLVLC